MIAVREGDPTKEGSFVFRIRILAGTCSHGPAGMKHSVWAKGETILQFHGTGPGSIQYVR